MAIVNKVLGQSLPAADTLTTLYTVPAATSAVCSTLSVCNTAGSTTFRIAIRPAGEAIASKHYIAYNSTLGDNESVFLTLGVTLATTDVVTVYSASGLLAFNLFGSEVA